MLNKVNLIGRIGTIEVNATKTGKTVANISLATTVKFKCKETNDWKEKTTWHRLKAFGDVANQFNLGKYSKGDLLYVEGSLETNSYEKEGQKHYVTDVVLDGFPKKLPKFYKQKGEQPITNSQSASSEQLDEAIGF